MLDLAYVSKNAIVWGDEKYQFYGHTSRELPMLKHFGIQVRSIMDDLAYCEAQYKIQTRQLYLTELTVYGMHKPYPKIGKTEPEGDPIVHYKELLERLSYYSGSFLMGQPFIAIRQNIFDYLSLRRVNCLNGDVKGVQDFSEQVQKVRQNIEGLKQQFYQEDAVHSKTSKQKRLLNRKIASIENDLSEQIYGSDLHNFR